MTDPTGFLRWLAVLGVAALVLGRFVGPAMPGLGVGMTHLVRGFELAGGVLSQLFAVGVIVGACFALMETGNTTIALWIRMLAMGACVFAGLVVLGGALAKERGPETAALIAGLAAGAFAILTAVASWGSRVTRLAGLSLGLVGAAAIAHALGSLAFMSFEKLLSPAALTTFARVMATIAAVLVGLALVLAIVYVGRAAKPEPEGGPAARPSLWSPATLFALVLAVVAARQAMAGSTADAGIASVLLKRASDRFLVPPAPYMRLPIRMFLGFLTPLTAASLLTARRVPALSAALALAIVAADVTSAPIGAMTLLLASLGVLLVARSGHVLWSTLLARPPSTSREIDRGASPASPASPPLAPESTPSSESSDPEATSTSPVERS
ncbi:MAG: hypothetical protein R3B70_29080 [Polyangiaceae bacterium]